MILIASALGGTAAPHWIAAHHARRTLLSDGQWSSHSHCRLLVYRETLIAPQITQVGVRPAASCTPIVPSAAFVSAQYREPKPPLPRSSSRMASQDSFHSRSLGRLCRITTKGRLYASKISPRISAYWRAASTARVRFRGMLSSPSSYWITQRPGCFWCFLS